MTPRLREPDAFWAAREAWRAAVVAASRYGVRAAPPRRYESRDQVRRQLLEAAQTGYAELAERLRAVAALPAASGDDPAAGPVAAAKALLGEGVVLVPRLTPEAFGAGPAASLAARLTGPDELDAWLEGAAAVREGAGLLADTLVLAEALGADPPRAAVAQLPHVAREPWLGGALPDASKLAGRVSVVLYGAGLLPGAGRPAGTPLAGLAVDEWDETVPHREQSTGVALPYDQPDATAPQCVLVAVAPERGLPWRLANLVATLHDTLELARNRTVELEHLGQDLYGQLLPLLVGEVVPEAAEGHQAPSGSRVILDLAQNNPAGA